MEKGETEVFIANVRYFTKEVIKSRLLSQISSRFVVVRMLKSISG